MDTNISKNLQQLILSLNISTREFARQCNMNYSTVYRVLSGEIIDQKTSTIIPICEKFGISADELLGLKKLSPKFYKNAKTINDFEEMLPLISLSDAVNWNKNLEDMQPEHWKTWYKTDIKVSQNAFAVELNDDKNSPIFLNGAILVIEPDFRLSDDIFVLAKMKDSRTAFIRKVMIAEPNIYLEPLKAQVQASILTEDQIIIGKIVQMKVDL